MIKIYVNTAGMSPMSSFRGIGVYADFLTKYLSHTPGVSLVSSEKEAQVIHYPFFDLFFSTLPVKKHGKTVITIHDVIPLVFPDHYKPGVRGSLRFLKQMVALQSVDAIITDSECSKRDIMKYLKVPAEKIHVVLLAGNPELSPQPAHVVEKVHAMYHLPETYLLYVGDINYNKNLPALIGALAKCDPSVHLVMVGRTLTNQQIPEGRALRDAIAQHQLKNRVHMLIDIPRAPASILAALFTGAKAYIQPSLYEGFGLSVLDAMRCEIPVLSANTSSLPEVVGDAAVCFNPRDVEEMATAIMQVVQYTSQEREQMNKKAAEQLKKFSWDKVAVQTAEVYRNVLG